MSDKGITVVPFHKVYRVLNKDNITIGMILTNDVPGEEGQDFYTSYTMEIDAQRNWQRSDGSLYTTLESAIASFENSPLIGDTGIVKEPEEIQEVGNVTQAESLPALCELCKVREGTLIEEVIICGECRADLLDENSGCCIGYPDTFCKLPGRVACWNNHAAMNKLEKEKQTCQS